MDKILVAIGTLMALSLAAVIYGAILLSRGSTDSTLGDLDLSWSPDGARIAFTSDRDGNEEIYVVDLETSEETNLTNNEAPDTRPAWSPDGSKIAFLSQGIRGADIYVVNADGTGLTNLTNYPGRYTGSVWSPDSTPALYGRRTVHRLCMVAGQLKNLVHIYSGREARYSGCRSNRSGSGSAPRVFGAGDIRDER